MKKIKSIPAKTRTMVQFLLEAVVALCLFTPCLLLNITIEYTIDWHSNFIEGPYILYQQGCWTLVPHSASLPPSCFHKGDPIAPFCLQLPDQPNSPRPDSSPPWNVFSRDGTVLEQWPDSEVLADAVPLHLQLCLPLFSMWWRNQFWNVFLRLFHTELSH